MLYAEVAVDALILEPKTYTYSIPKDMNISVGQMVQVPLRNKFVDGIVTEVKDSVDLSYIKPIYKCDDIGALLNSHQIYLARWISDYYFTSFYTCLVLMIPPGFSNRSQQYLQAHESSTNDMPEDLFKALGKKLKFKGNIDQLKKLLSKDSVIILNKLIKSKNITVEWDWVNKTTMLDDLRVQRLSEAVDVNPVIDKTKFRPKNIYTDDFILTDYQHKAVQKLSEEIKSNKFSVNLLHGITGSGKTEVYLRCIEECLNLNKRVLFLIPEISLIDQVIKELEMRFPGKITYFHSSMKAREHRKVWWDIHANKFEVVVGPRSALFTPIDNIGLIIIDEEHEWNYKQEEPNPRYNARSVAMIKAENLNATVLLGSATPDLITYHRAKVMGSINMHELPYRISDKSMNRSSYSWSDNLADVEVVDMKEELQNGNTSIFSTSLLDNINQTAYRDEQIILLVNRRGTSVSLRCQHCSEIVSCSSCNAVLTYHSSIEKLICHLCNRKYNTNYKCSKCESSDIKMLGFGTQRVVSEIKEHFPDLLVSRWDRDISQENRHDPEVLRDFSNGNAQILVGTQMVAKGLNIPNVTLVGIVLADIGLFIPDYRSSEKIFQLIYQVVGRSGRGEKPGKGIVQTYFPDNYVIDLASKQDFSSFYEVEAKFRQIHNLPPYSRIVKLVYSHFDPQRAQKEAERMKRELMQIRSKWDYWYIDISGPVPSFYNKLRGKYRWQIILRGPNPRDIINRVKISDNWIIDVDPLSFN
ncbi:MAG: primosomal protein N' [SAR202 cluster bacterium]|nr:primosomal protein N' [Chloroflexota bacterium]MQG50450.1 primosomal protein N' [SAR202 cluster bacterium]